MRRVRRFRIKLWERIQKAIRLRNKLGKIKRWRKNHPN